MKRRKGFPPGVLAIYAGMLLLAMLPVYLHRSPRPSLELLHPRGAPDLYFASIPAGVYPLGSPAGRRFEQPQEQEVARFSMLIHEVRVADFVCFLNATGRDFPDSPQIERRERGYRACPGQDRMPVTHVDYLDAEAYARWLGQHTGRSVRLPTEAEWEAAARGGVVGGRYPGGWQDEGRVDALEPRSGPANAYGLFNLAGNVYEWCIPDMEQAIQGLAAGRGGSWTERDPSMQTVYARAFFDRNYRDADMGFRVIFSQGMTGDTSYRP